MRIGENNGMLSVSFGVMSGEEKENKTKNGRMLSIYAGDLQQAGSENAIEKKRQEIREKAVKVLLDKFEQDLKEDEALDESRANVQAAQEEQKAAQERLTELKEQLENAPEEMAEDEETMENYNEAVQDAERRIAEAQGTIIGENAAIRDAKLSKLGKKYEQTMGYAADQEQKILEAGSAEIMGMVTQEAMNHIEEVYQENIEKAQEQQEKKEEQEEKLENLKEDRQEIEQQTAAVREEAAERQAELTEQVNETVSESTDLDKELRRLQQEAELVDEELKGLVVDSQL